MGIKKVIKLPGVKPLKGKAAKLLRQATKAGQKALKKAVDERNQKVDLSFHSDLYIGPEETDPNRIKNPWDNKFGIPTNKPISFEIDPELKRELKAQQRAREENAKQKGGGTYKK
jgi:hypothetical protein